MTRWLAIAGLAMLSGVSTAQSNPVVMAVPELAVTESVPESVPESAVPESTLAEPTTTQTESGSNAPSEQNHNHNLQMLVVTGLGGEPIFTKRFDGWALNLRDVALEKFGVAPQHLVWLASSGHEHSSEEAVRDNVRATLERFNRQASGATTLVVVLIGHGTAQGKEAAFNLRGTDLRPEDLAQWISDSPASTQVVVNLASASGPFVEPLSAPQRVIITATANAAEHHVTRFGGPFVQAFADSAADADKNGRVSLFEAFSFAREQVAASFKADKLIQTEHALLDDDGDGRGSLDLAASMSDGILARSVYLEADSNVNLSSGERLRLTLEARTLIAEVDALKRRKDILRDAEYDDYLEAILVRLALNRRALRSEDSE